MSPLLSKVIISAFFSVMYGTLSYFMLLDVPDAWRWALISGLGTFSMLLLFLLLQDERRTRRYARAEKQLPCRPHFQVGANCREDRKIASVRVCLCENEVILVNVQRREPALTRISRSQLRTAERVSQVELRLTLMDGRILLLLTPYMEELTRQLRRIGWPVMEAEA